MTEIGRKTVTRIIQDVFYRNRRLVARMAPEGVYVKTERERWSSAYFIPWMAVHSVGAKLKAKALKEEKIRRRKEKRLGRA